MHFEKVLGEGLMNATSVQHCRSKLNEVLDLRVYPQRPLRIFIEAAAGNDRHVLEEEIAA
jgi:hypothetical protein